MGSRSLSRTLVIECNGGRRRDVKVGSLVLMRRLVSARHYLLITCFHVLVLANDVRFDFGMMRLDMFDDCGGKLVRLT